MYNDNIKEGLKSYFTVLKQDAIKEILLEQEQIENILSKMRKHKLKYTLMCFAMCVKNYKEHLNELTHEENTLKEIAEMVRNDQNIPNELWERLNSWIGVNYLVSVDKYMLLENTKKLQALREILQEDSHVVDVTYYKNKHYYSEYDFLKIKYVFDNDKDSIIHEYETRGKHKETLNDSWFEYDSQNNLLTFYEQHR